MTMYYEEMKHEKENKAYVRRFYEEFFNERHHDAIDEMFLPSYVHHTTEAAEEKMNFEEYREHMLLLARAFPHMKVVLEDLIAEENKVTARYTMYGIQEQDLPGIPAKGKQIKVEVITIVRMQDGKMAEGWECYDSLDMAMQLGIVQIVSTLEKGPQEKGYFPEGEYNV